MTKNQMLIQALYISLRNEKRDNFREEDYFWRLGTAIMDELKTVDSVYARELLFPSKDEIPTLYGIRVEPDYKNPDNIRLYEDITYTIGEELKGGAE